jgi:hypothetical protein
MSSSATLVGLESYAIFFDLVKAFDTVHHDHLYTTGVHQGDNMSPILFLVAIQAFLDTLQLEAQPINFSYFPKNKNGNAEMAKGRLINQRTSAKGTTFDL